MISGYIPSNDPKLIIIDFRITNEIEYNLRKITDAKIIKNPKTNFLYEEICGHPDIVLTPINANTLVCAPHLYSYYLDLLSPFNINLISGNSSIGPCYPENINYNISLFGKTAIHNFKHTDLSILSILKKNKINLLNVKQGYSKCSTCIIDDNSIITSDNKIHSVVIDNHLNSLHVSSDEILLSNKMNGFIGGASGTFADSITFFGDINLHSDNEKIKKYIESKNKKVISLSEKKLTDYGSIIVL